MVKKKRVRYPPIFTDVLQAISDLKDINGSTLPKIAKQVQTGICVSKEQPKPRNVLMQVQRALRHGVTSGVLKQKAGKYKFSFGREIFGSHDLFENKEIWAESLRSRGRKKGKCRVPRGKKCVPPNRRKQYQTDRRKRRGCKRSHCFTLSKDIVHESRSKSGSCNASSGNSGTSDDHDDSQVKICGRPKRSVWSVSKTKKISKPFTRSRRPLGIGATKKAQRQKRLQKKSPELIDPNIDTASEGIAADEESQEVDNDPERPDNDEEYQQQGLVPYVNIKNEEDIGAPECDNPECLCNLKQETDDDSGYERPPFM